MASLPGSIGTGIELLAVAVIEGAMSLEERASAVRQGNRTFFVTYRNAFDEPLLFEVAQVAFAHIERRITGVPQIPLGDYPKRAYR